MHAWRPAPRNKRGTYFFPFFNFPLEISFSRTCNINRYVHKMLSLSKKRKTPWEFNKESRNSFCLEKGNWGEIRWRSHFLQPTVIFSDISERNNDYSDPLDFRRGWGVGEVRVVTFFVLEVPDYESGMLIYIYIYIYLYFIYVKILRSLSYF